MSSEDSRCVEEVFPTKGGFKTRRCNKPAGHGENGQYCTEHAKSTKDIGPLNDKRKKKDRLWR